MSVHHAHRVLSEALKHALRRELVVRNVAEMVDPPSPRGRTMKTLESDEVAQILIATRETEWHPIVLTAVSTGLRRGEILGLRWRDADLDLQLLSVTRALYKRSGVMIFKEPKSTHSRRQVGLTPFLVAFLRAYRIERGAHFSMFGYRLKEDDLVFCRDDGSPIDASSLTHGFARIVRDAGLSHTRFHDLRHTFASLMLHSAVTDGQHSQGSSHSGLERTARRGTIYEKLPLMREALAPCIPSLEGKHGRGHCGR